MARIDYCGTSKSSERTREILGKNRNANIFRMMAHSPSYLEQYCRLGGAIRNKGELDPVVRELAITRTGILCEAPYEIVAHKRIGKNVGVTDEQKAALSDRCDLRGNHGQTDAGGADRTAALGRLLHHDVEVSGNLRYRHAAGDGSGLNGRWRQVAVSKFNSEGIVVVAHAARTERLTITRLHIFRRSKENGTLRSCAGTMRSGLDDRQHLAFGNHVVEADEYRFELARGRRSDRNFHLHGFDECNFVAIADAAADFNGKRADTPGHLGHNLDVWHSVLRDSRRAHRDRNTRIIKGGRPPLTVVAADCLR